MRSNHGLRSTTCSTITVFVVDTNILVHAANVDSERHAPALALVESLRRSPVPWAVTWSILYEFWRVTTHPWVLSAPLSRENVGAFVEALCSSRSLQVLTETDRHREFFRSVLAELPAAAANLAHDAHIVAVMREHGVRDIYTADADFHRFTGIHAHDPLRA